MVDLGLLSPFSSPDLVDNPVVADAEEPGRHLPPALPVTRSAPPHIEECVLGHLFRGPRISQHPNSKGVDRPGVPVVQRLQCLLASKRHDPQQLLVAECSDRLGAITDPSPSPRTGMYESTGVRRFRLSEHVLVLIVLAVPAAGACWQRRCKKARPFPVVVLNAVDSPAEGLSAKIPDRARHWPSADPSQPQLGAVYPFRTTGTP